MRNKLAKRTQDPQIATVRLYDFRHYFGTMQYWKYRDVALTAQDLGHKSWNTTMAYVHLTRILELQAKDGWICKTAKTVDEAKTLVETGYEYVTEMDGIKLFRKRK